MADINQLTRRLRGIAVLLTAILVSLMPLPGSAQTPPAPKQESPKTTALLAKESVWFAAHREVVVGVTREGWAPFNQVVGGKLTGLSAAYLAYALRPRNVTLRPRVYDDNRSLLQAACRGEVDIITDVSRTPERERCLVFSRPYYEGQAVIVTRNDDQGAASPSNATTARYAVEEGFFMAHQLRERHPAASFVYVANTAQALRAVAGDKADIYVGLRPAVEYEINKASLSNLVMLEAHAEPMGELRFAFPRGRTALRQSIDEALQKISREERIGLLSQSVQVGSSPVANSTSFVLSKSEREFLAALPPLRVAVDVRWDPFSYLDETGRPTGILPEYWAYLARTLGLRFKPHPYDGPVAARDAFASGAIDVLMVAAAGAAKVDLPHVTRPVETYPVVVVGPQNAASVKALTDLAGLKVAVVDGSGDDSELRRRVPSITLVHTHAILEAMRIVHEGKADALVGNLAVVDLPIQGEYAGVLKVLGPAGYSQSIGFQVAPRFEPLIPLIDRALGVMNEEQRRAIRNRYLAVNYHFTPTWYEVARKIAPFLLAGTAGLIVLLHAFFRLRREVRHRKQTEQQLAFQLRFRTMLMDMAPIPIGVSDQADRYIEVNSAFEQLVGLRREDMLGKTVEECSLFPGQRGKLIEAIAHATQRGIWHKGVRVDYLDASGTSRHGLYWHGPLLNERGEVTGAVGAVVDITSAIEAERKVHDTEQRLEDVTRNLPALVLQMRRDPIGKLSLPYVGGNLELLSAIELDDLRQDAEFLDSYPHPEDRALLLAAIEESAHALQPLAKEFRSRYAEGYRWIQTRAIPQREGDGSTLWSGYCIDVTSEHLRAEELSAARDVAESASRAKDQFLAMMSHEIRTPMSGVLGLVEVLGQTGLHGEQAAMLRMIQDSAGALLQILDDILDYSKIEAGKLDFEDLPFDMRETCDLALGLLASKAHEKGLKLRLHVTAAVAASLRGDSVRLRQVLFNLLSNAIKFTQQGEVSVFIDVASRRPDPPVPRDDLPIAHNMDENSLVVGSLEPDRLETAPIEMQTLAITVADTGIGIAEDIQLTLFEPFVQADSTTSRRFGGTGLGLSICDRLIKRMGGTLELHSQLGAGTRVTLLLSLPVERRAYDDEVLGGAQMVVLLRDAEAVSAIADGLAALGVKAVLLDPRTVSAKDLRAVAAVDAVFLDDDEPLPAALGDAPVIHITERPKSAGYRLTGSDIRLSINPLSWRGLRAACIAAVVGAPLPNDMVPTVPLAAAARSREQAKRDGTLILVSEDNPINRQLIGRQLHLLGYACDATANGLEALDAYDTHDYAMLFTDCHMPQLDGYALARSVRERERASGDARRLPIIGITASIESEEPQRCRDAGMDDCLIKPAQLDLLYACLQKWLPETVMLSETWAVGDPARSAEIENLNVGIPASTDASLPPLNLEGLRQTMGSWSDVGTLLHVFVQSTEADISAFRILLRHPELAALREWHHRVAGSAMVLQYPPLLNALQAFRQGLEDEELERIQAKGNVLLDKLERFMSHLTSTRRTLTD